MGANTEKLPEPPSLAADAAVLLKLLGGTKTTTNPGDTSALQSTFAGLQGTNYEAMLKAIFQQAGGQIPTLQQALGNAVGARSGGNSAVAAALQKLLAQTSTGAMDQVAKLQAQNFQTQANIGDSIARTTQGTTKQEGTNVGNGLAEIAKLIAVLQGAKTLGADKWIKDLTSTSATPAPVDVPTTAATTPASPGLLSSAPAPAIDYSLSSTPGQNSTPLSIGSQFTGADYTLPATSLSNQGLVAPTQAAIPNYVDPAVWTPDYSLAPAVDTSQGLDSTPSYQAPAYVDPTTWKPDYSLADGGIVHGRGNNTAPMEPSDTPAAGTTEDENEAKSNARFDKGFTANKFLDTFRELLGNNDLGKAEGYADGGTVRAGGSRRSANPSVTLDTPKQSSALMSAEELQKLLVPQAQDLASPVATMANSDIANKLASSSLLQSSGGASSSPGLTGTPTSGGLTGKDVATAIGKVGAISNISGVTGGNHIPNDVMQSLGLFGNLAGAETPAQAAKAVGMGALGIAAPQLAGPVGFAMDPSQVTAVNLVTSLNPVGALANAGLSLFGSSLGSLALGRAPSLEGNPISGATVNNPTGGLLGFGGELGKTANDFTISSPVHTGTVDVTDLGTLADHGGNSSSSEGHGQFGGLGNSGYGHGDQLANGGAINGPGTAASDSIPAKLSDGEFVMSADVVDVLGEDFFNQLQAAFHTPVAQRAHA